MPAAVDPQLSLCLIVRNGGAALAACLQSARPFVDELVVVDTGSTDDSRRRAADAGARVFDFLWCDDFSAARNFSLDQATGDWILWLDADDLLPAASGEALRRLIAAEPSRAVAFWMTVEERTTGRGGQPVVRAHEHLKLFPRHPQVRFRYRVHEQVAPSIAELGWTLRSSGAVVRHAHVDRTPAGERARLERNLRLALLDLAERPDDPFVWLSVGTTYLFLPGKTPQAVDFLSRSVRGLKQGSATQLNAYLYLGQAWGASGDRRQEEAVYREALGLFPGDAMLGSRLGWLYARQGRLAEAIDCYQATLQGGKLRRSVLHVRGLMAQAALRLGELYIRTGRRADAERCWEDYLQRDPGAAAVRQALRQSYLQPCAITASPPPP